MKHSLIAAALACAGVTGVLAQQPALRDDFFWLGQINKATAVRLDADFGKLLAAQ